MSQASGQRKNPGMAKIRKWNSDAQALGYKNYMDLVGHRVSRTLTPEAKIWLKTGRLPDIRGTGGCYRRRRRKNTRKKYTKRTYKWRR